MPFFFLFLSVLAPLSARSFDLRKPFHESPQFKREFLFTPLPPPPFSPFPLPLSKSLRSFHFLNDLPYFSFYQTRNIKSIVLGWWGTWKLILKKKIWTFFFSLRSSSPPLWYFFVGIIFSGLIFKRKQCSLFYPFLPPSSDWNAFHNAQQFSHPFNSFFKNTFEYKFLSFWR